MTRLGLGMWQTITILKCPPRRTFAMRPSGDGDHKYVVSPEDAAAIRSKKMWLRSSYYRRPDQKRVEKYLSRGFTLVAEPAQPAIP